MASIRQGDYVAHIEYDEDFGMFHGQVANLSSPITFYSNSAEGLKAEMKRSLDEYFAVCAERGIAPEKAYSGRLNIRTTPTEHRRLAQAAARAGESLNSWATRVLHDAEQRAGH
ncbi:MAG: type II toxin-antitoxin system HicB family antitoxin [Salinisphaera sp.]|nr:type II toxin-antitoxin system HicB family antitoxin [Salinisphaera sp.]